MTTCFMNKSRTAPLAAGAMNVKTHCIHAVTIDTYSHEVPELQEAAAKGFDQGLRKHKNADHLVGTGDGG